MLSSESLSILQATLLWSPSTKHNIRDETVFSSFRPRFMAGLSFERGRHVAGMNHVYEYAHEIKANLQPRDDKHAVGRIACHVLIS